MKTDIHDKYKNTPQGREAESILRSCVHCGFCTATCPTYQELNDERDGPRGRIYLIKQLLETDRVSEKTLTHLDRCLTCRSCETTCPSGVEYGHLLDIGREIIEQKIDRPLNERVMRWGLRRVLPNEPLFSLLLKIGQTIRPILPDTMREKVPPKQDRPVWPIPKHPRRMIALKGCVQGAATPETNAAAARVLDRLGITLQEIAGAGCCGAVNYHLADSGTAKKHVRHNIDAWWPHVEAGVEALVMTASGCGVMVKDYGYILKDDAEYADKASRISAMTYDLSEILAHEDISALKVKSVEKVAVHCPCTLQHGQKLPQALEDVFNRLGVSLAKTRDKHLCCGSAGTYSILQPEMSQKLLDNKLTALSVDSPDVIATANIGCQLHLASKSDVPVRHWIELVDHFMS
ncbi:glycolate oxidase iron-sulfur subunit [Hahella sp. CCB-MM4]|uniref:glycolate oxidase subunit GlcF n=1 Tax=Hahella sp. (strain CCB-MM4) TaxID=1926491 RepID=UPI000B9BC64B|nr:glycolate oxidase subunit GlcF [Hahella sp. CCB-MM4]OZG71928.1 glycolate oxidase iron-sulfur subunit [Hahella sp. CCB-MM4]